jgi:cell filamentation protein
VTSYDAIEDPYCYPGTNVLRNLKNLRTQRALTRYETAMTSARGEEPLPNGRLSVSHYRAVHRHLFRDVYSWSGKTRTVRISKGGSMFCYPEHIDAQLKLLFDRLGRDDYLRGREVGSFVHGAAEFLGELNAIHAFRDGNGRTQLAFLLIVATKAGYPLDLEKLQPRAFLRAMIRSFSGDVSTLAQQLEALAR